MHLPFPTQPLTFTEQKIACDKTQPHCNNCVKKGRQCLGYGLKLSWPRKGDERRSASLHKKHFILPVRSKEAIFVHATSEDVKASQQENGKFWNLIIPKSLFKLSWD